MSDSSIKVTPGTGSDPDVATDTLPDGRRAQQIKLLDGAPGGTNEAAVTAAGALRVDGSGVTQPVSFSGNVTVVDGGGSVSVDDGGGSLTIDGTVTANIGTTNGLALDATLTGGTQKTKIVDSGGTNVAAVSAAGAVKVDGSAVTQPVSIATAPVLVAGAAIIGKVGIDQTTPGTTNLVALAANQSVNVAQINAVTPLMGAGATGTGSPRVTIATDGQGQLADNSAFTDGTTRVDVAGFILDDTAGTALTENDVAAGRIDSKRAIVNVIEDATTRGQRAAVSAAGAVAANIAQVAGATVAQGHGTAATAVRVELPTDGTGVIGLNTGSNVVGKVGIDQTTPGTTNAVQPVPGTSGGLFWSRTLSAASTNATNVKGSAGQLYILQATNTNASVRHLKLYNKATAPTVGTDTPFATFALPQNVPVGFSNDQGVAFGTGIGFALTTGIADADTGAVAANDIVVNIGYK